ncbi:HMG (high mobility group) box domain-containing protein [Hirsutella rhossiliensis]|uniref:HMG (High mobility group) box domain-containing protein n=1 Tax=Hirsutella rhossiliensis TaxID=111463 RepID=A0A9P8MYG1_9HYPO|nr:HMG (high mobility group) box domain-containing protein [Hirsutella rhossiliensis]KAH0964363.1 HMG (high mobility group) box domain-containing protein [Hirsutella rhossiliensis]
MEMGLVETIANNFSRRVQQPVKVFHDDWREKYRLCPLPLGVQANDITYGSLCFECDSSEPLPEMNSKDDVVDGKTGHIPRPRNKWILYRQYHAAIIKKEIGLITASEISTMISNMWRQASEAEKAIWQQKAEEEDRLHKEKYPDYKYTTKKSPSKGN